VDISEDIITILRAMWRTEVSWFDTREGKRFTLLQRGQTGRDAHPAYFSTCNCSPFLGGSNWSIKLVTYLHLEPRLRTGGVIASPPHMASWNIERQLALYLTRGVESVCGANNLLPSWKDKDFHDWFTRVTYRVGNLLTSHVYIFSCI
jgi:hypothetical protein